MSDDQVARKLAKLRHDDELLAAFLVLESLKGTASAWAPYLKLLPQAVDSSPIAFAPDDLAELHDDFVVDATAKERQQLQVAFKRFQRLFKRVVAATYANETVVDLDLYTWARFIVNSRALTLHGARFLVPFADMFNGRPQHVRQPSSFLPPGIVLPQFD